MLMFFNMLQCFQYFTHLKHRFSWKKLPHDNITTILLILCLKLFKDFILTFSPGESFFSEKEFLNLYTMILNSSLLDGCVNEVVDNQTSFQGYKCFCFLQCHALTVIHFVIGEVVC